MPGAKPAPIASRANEKSTRAKSLQVKPCNRHSLRDGFTAYSALSPGNRAFLPPSPCEDRPRRLDISVEISGPHGFAVRLNPRSSLASQSVHRIPHPTLVTIA